MTPWWKWPEDRRTGTVAWYVIARRLMFLPIFAFGVAVALVGCFLMYGRRETVRLYDSI